MSIQRSLYVILTVVIMGGPVDGQGGVPAALHGLRQGTLSRSGVGLAVAVVCSDSKAAMDFAGEFSSNADWSRRRLAASIWSGLGPDVVLSRAVHSYRLHEDTSWVVREETFLGLSGATPSEECLGILKTGLSDPIWRVRLAALKSVARWPINRWTRIEIHLVAAAADPDPMVRQVAVRALCKYGAAGPESLLILRDALLDQTLDISLRRSCWLRLNELGVRFEPGLESEGALQETLFVSTLANVQRLQSADSDAQLMNIVSHPEARHVLGERIIGQLIARLCQGKFILDDLTRGMETQAEKTLFLAILEQQDGDWQRSALMRDLVQAHVTGAEVIEVLLDEIPSQARNAVRQACRQLLLESRGEERPVPRWMSRVFDIWFALQRTPDLGALRDLSRHRGRSIRQRAVVALVRETERGRRARLLGEFLARSSKEELLLAAVAETLSKTPELEYLPFFLELAQSASGVRARLGGMRGLESLTGKSVAAALHHLLERSPHVEVQMRALAHLLLIGNQQALTALLIRLRSVTGQPSLDDVRLMGMAAVHPELTAVIQAYVSEGRFADRTLPGMLDPLKRALSEQAFQTVAVRAVQRGLSGERPSLNGNTARHLLLKHKLAGALSPAMSAFESGHVRISEALLEGVVELAITTRQTDEVQARIIKYYLALGEGDAQAEKRAALVRGLVRLGGRRGREIVDTRISTAMALLASAAVNSEVNLGVANEVVEGISALLDHGSEAESKRVLQHVATLIEGHVQRRLSVQARSDQLNDTQGQLLHLILVGLNSDSRPTIEAHLHEMLDRHPVVEAFMAHELITDWMLLLGPRSGDRAPCECIGRLALSQAARFDTTPQSTQLLLIRCLLDRGDPVAAALALSLTMKLERWRLTAVGRGMNRGTSFLRMQSVSGVAFDPQPIVVAKAIARLQMGVGLVSREWQALQQCREWEELLSVLRQLRQCGDFPRARELLERLLPTAGRRSAVLLESVKLLMSQGRWDDAIVLSSKLAERLRVVRPSVSSQLLVLQAACRWVGGATEAALKVLQTADARHPSGQVDLLSDPELMGWLEGLAVTDWFQTRNS